MIYLILLLLLLFLSFHYDIKEKSNNKYKWYKFLLVIFIFLAGLRWRLMVDTPGYIWVFYHQIPLLKDFSFEDPLVGQYSLWYFLNSIVKSIGGRYYVVQLLEAAFVNILIFNYIKKHSRYLFTCLFFYAITCYLDYSMQIMRAAFSIAICLYANDYCLERKWLKGYFLYLFAFFFHSQTIAFLAIPLLFSLRLNKKGVFVLIGALFAGHIIQVGLGDYVKLLELYGEIGEKAIRYSESDYGSQQGNLNFLIVYIFPYLFYSLFSLYLLRKYCTQSKILVLEPFVMIGILFLIIQMNLHIAYRYVDYFRLYFAILYAEVFVLLIKKARRFDLSLAYFRAVIVFIPFLFLLFYSLSFTLYTFYPYSSVIERSIDKTRELKYMEVGSNGQPPADINEY